ncbi:MAG: SurA N-terminal domain-containing protein [Desulfobulbaceae bacterium]|nr:SurA N-terminal domain-containing protein [Desulfobulbaceae bacterium]
MLNILRKRSQSIVIQVIVLVIAIVFIFWGVGTNIGNKRNYIAKVNDEEISFSEYQRAYDSIVDNYRVQFGGSIPPGFLEALGLKQQVLNQLIQTALIRQGGREMGVTVSELETQNKIKDMDVFQTNGQFDLNLYKMVLAQNAMNPSSFEASINNELLNSKVQEALQGFAIVPDGEVQSGFELNNEEIQLAYYAVESEKFLNKVEVKEDELAEWYEENKNNYLTEAQIRLRYLFFDYAEDMDKLEISEEKLREQYEQNREQYVVPEQRHARHILFAVSEADDADVRAEKKGKAEEVLQFAREGRDFTELAREYSEDSSGPNGGDLGFLARGEMAPPVDQAVFQMQPGEISDVVETRFGYHIIKLEEVREGGTRSFEEVREEIADGMRNQEVRGYTFKRASQAYEEIIRAGSLEKYNEQHEKEVRQTDYFSRSTPPGPPLSDPDLMQTAFRLNKGELSSLVQTGEGYAILFVDDVRQPEVPELDAIRDRVVEDYTMAKSVELARRSAEDILQKARDEKSLAQAIPPSENLRKTGYISRANGPAEADLPEQVIRKSFEMSLKDPYPAEPFVQDDLFIVYELLERKIEEKTPDEQQRLQLEEQLLTSTRNSLLTAWLTSMQENADIWINEPLL